MYAAWQQLNGSIRETIDLRLYEIATVAAAAELRSSYCSLAHGNVLYERFGVAPGDELDERDRAVQRLRALSSSKTLDAAGVLPDASCLELPGALREPLVVGRPIER